MANCKNCLSYGSCNDHWLGTGDMPNLCSEEYICEHFKDRNRFVELPSVSLPIEIFLTDNINESFVLRDYYFDSRNQKFMMTIYGVEAKKYFSRELTDFGKTVFLTKPEAEQALKVSENGD